MKFSVIIPVYNKADTICAALDSIYNQLYKDYEIILVDDGSTDNLSNVIASRLSPDLKVIHQANSGVSVARNTGIDNSSGDYLCFLDADDLWKPNHLTVLNELITAYSDCNVFVTSHEEHFSDNSVFFSNNNLKNYPESFIIDDLLGLLNSTSYSVINSNSMCVHRSVLIDNNIHFEPGVRIGEDSDVWYRLGLKNNVVISQKCTTVYRRELSTATKQSTHVHNWIFSQRIDTILSDCAISDKVKSSVMFLLDRYFMTSSREYMIDGNRKEAKKILSKIKHKYNKRYFLTVMFTFLPYSFCRKLLKRKF